MKSLVPMKKKLLGILLDFKLNLDSHITSLYKKVGQKLSALARINNFDNNFDFN